MLLTFAVSTHLLRISASEYIVYGLAKSFGNLNALMPRPETL